MATGLWYTHIPNFGSLSWFWRCKEHPCPLSPHLGLWRTLEVPDWGLAYWCWFGYGHWFLYTLDLSFGSLSWLWRCKEHPCSLSPDSGLWRMLEVPDWNFVSWYWFGYGHWSLVHPYSKFWLSILTFKLQRISMSSKSWLRPLKGFRGSWLGFCILILICIWSLVFDTPTFQILALYLAVERAKNIQVL